MVLDVATLKRLSFCFVKRKLSNTTLSIDTVVSKFLKKILDLVRKGPIMKQALPHLACLIVFCFNVFYNY